MSAISFHDVIPVSEFRKNLAEILKFLNSEDSGFRLVGSHRKAQAVLLSVEKFLKLSDSSSAISMEQVQKKKGTMLRLAEFYGFESVGVSGSVARGSSNDDSDLDVVVKTKRGITGFDIASYEIDLENLFGVKVDVLPLNSLHPERHGEILRDLVYLQHD
jgi:uncharacterized protein